MPRFNLKLAVIFIIAIVYSILYFSNQEGGSTNK